MTATPPGRALRCAASTDGLGDLPLDDALSLLARTGYDGVALTLGGPHLAPAGDDARQDVERVRARCEALGLGVVVRVAPGDPSTAGLVAASEQDRGRQLELLRRGADVADALGAEALVLDPGVLPTGADRPQAWRWLREGVLALVRSHGARAAALAVEPAPGRLVADGDSWQRLQASVPEVRLALHAGHCLAAGPYAPDQAARVFAPHLAAVTVPERLSGDDDGADLPALLRALADVGHRGLVALDLPREGRDGPRAAAAAFDRFRRADPGGPAPDGAVPRRSSGTG